GRPARAVHAGRSRGSPVTATHRYLSLGAGVQSSAALLLAAPGDIAPFDAAIFADTGWEPAAVYTHLDRLEEFAAEAGIPIVRVSAGTLPRDALDPSRRRCGGGSGIRIRSGCRPGWSPRWRSDNGR